MRISILLTLAACSMGCACLRSQTLECPVPTSEPISRVLEIETARDLATALQIEGELRAIRCADTPVWACSVWNADGIARVPVGDGPALTWAMAVSGLMRIAAVRCSVVDEALMCSFWVRNE